MHKAYKELKIREGTMKTMQTAQRVAQTKRPKEPIYKEVTYRQLHEAALPKIFASRSITKEYVQLALQVWV